MKKYLGLMFAGLAAYMLTLFLAQRLLAGGLEPDWLRISLSIAPMLPVAAICWIVFRSISRLDEMQRKLQLEALSLAFAGTALITFGYGFLEGIGMPRLSMFVVWPLMAVLWVAGLVIGRIRYR
ncbi:hypothetical protein [Martelella mediterranea]|uniref:Transmembrane protein n=1 Tax=Martelella mediterranea DSM 17316 TaxID=1122214 RepID=A0A1U9Z1Y1_9HYPH|nr:hypothetical protein [Martelella mediterranea]AQZ51696.1 hypothetical protein Mame_02367 [Martelella mediterranea DSM 17316]